MNTDIYRLKVSGPKDLARDSNINHDPPFCVGAGVIASSVETFISLTTQPAWQCISRRYEMDGSTHERWATFDIYSKRPDLIGLPPSQLDSRVVCNEIRSCAVTFNWDLK